MHTGAFNICSKRESKYRTSVKRTDQSQLKLQQIAKEKIAVPQLRKPTKSILSAKADKTQPCEPNPPKTPKT